MGGPAPCPFSLHPCPLPQYLACPFPAALGELSSLTLLDLTMNDLSGSLHSDVAAGGANGPRKAAHACGTRAVACWLQGNLSRRPASPALHI